MYEDVGSVLGVSTAAVILPKTASVLTGINYFILLGGFIAFLIAYNLIIKVITNYMIKKS